MTAPARIKNTDLVRDPAIRAGLETLHEDDDEHGEGISRECEACHGRGWIFPRRLQCGMRDDCGAPVTHIDEKGFIYCTEHGIKRRDPYYGRRCRKLRPHELRRLERGEQVKRY